MGIKAVWSYAALINAIAFLLMGIDKRRAQHGKWRIREKTLFASAFLGGGPGALLGMRLFRHKTKKGRFRFGMPAICLLNTAAYIAVWYFID